LSTNLVSRFYCLFDFRNIGTKLENFKKLQGNLKCHQNKCHPGNVPDTRRQCAKAIDQWAKEWPASQTPSMAGPTLQPFTGRLHGDTLQDVVTENSKPKVGGGRTPWPPGHVARLAGHHLVSYRPKQVGNPSLDPYKYPANRWKSTHHTLLIVLHL
jgi:hypothetical protein